MWHRLARCRDYRPDVASPHEFLPGAASSDMLSRNCRRDNHRPNAFPGAATAFRQAPFCPVSRDASTRRPNFFSQRCLKECGVQKELFGCGVQKELFGCSVYAEGAVRMWCMQKELYGCGYSLAWHAICRVQHVECAMLAICF